MQTIADYEHAFLVLMDERVEMASDDELFANGYLSGHISLAASACEQAEMRDFGELIERVDASLKAAQSELTPADQALVRELWQTLQRRFVTDVVSA